MTDALTLDRRQQLAAAQLLMAFDLPAPMAAASRQMIEAARVCPGLTMGELPNLGPGSRRACLAAARDLIDELIDEIDNDPDRSDPVH